MTYAERLAAEGAAVDGEIATLTTQRDVAAAGLAAAQNTITAQLADMAALRARLAALSAQPRSSWPRVASVHQNPGEGWSDAVLRTLGYRFTGVVRYFPTGKVPQWDASLQALADKYAQWPLQLQVTFKTYDPAGLTTIHRNIPKTWLPLLQTNYKQEPEDDLTTAADQKAYRDTYVDIAKLSAANGAPLPWVEWQEWTTDPANGKGWDLAAFTPPADAFAGVLWSLFEYGEKDRLSDQVARIQAASARHAPGKPVGLMASAYTLEPVGGPFTDAQLTAQAAWLTKAHRLTRAAGFVQFAWYNYLFPGIGGAAGESRLEKNPKALAAWAELI